MDFNLFKDRVKFWEVAGRMGKAKGNEIGDYETIDGESIAAEIFDKEIKKDVREDQVDRAKLSFIGAFMQEYNKVIEAKENKRIKEEIAKGGDIEIGEAIIKIILLPIIYEDEDQRYVVRFIEPGNIEDWVFMEFNEIFILYKETKQFYNKT